MMCPCKDCEKKGCSAYHDKCEKYLEYSAYRKYTKSENVKKAKKFTTC